jgi:hypothetical protein
VANSTGAGDIDREVTDKSRALTQAAAAVRHEVMRRAVGL